MTAAVLGKSFWRLLNYRQRLDSIWPVTILWSAVDHTAHSWLSSSPSGDDIRRSKLRYRGDAQTTANKSQRLQWALTPVNISHGFQMKTLPVALDVELLFQTAVPITTVLDLSSRELKHTGLHVMSWSLVSAGLISKVKYTRHNSF